MNVDTASAKEFMKETLEKISPEALASITGDLRLKSEAFQKILGLENLPHLTDEGVLKIFRSVFSTRRKAKELLDQFPAAKFRPHAAELLHGGGRVEERFEQFFQELEGIPANLRLDLAGEMLHFTFPERYWLWCRWLFDPKNKTGALPLVLTEGTDLTAPTFGEMYLGVGNATAFVHTVGEAAGFQNISHSLFGADVYLCSVYVIYTYTVLRMRMTQEFNKVVPGLEEFSRRLLGVYHLEEYARF